MKKLKLLTGLLAAATILTTAVCAVSTEQTTVPTQVPSTEVITVRRHSGHHRRTDRAQHHGSHYGSSGCYYGSYGCHYYQHH